MTKRDEHTASPSQHTGWSDEAVERPCPRITEEEFMKWLDTAYNHPGDDGRNFTRWNMQVAFTAGSQWVWPVIQAEKQIVDAAVGAVCAWPNCTCTVSSMCPSDPVAWRADHMVEGEYTRKFTAIKRVAEIWRDQGLNVTPLYDRAALTAASPITPATGFEVKITPRMKSVAADCINAMGVNQGAYDLGHDLIAKVLAVASITPSVAKESGEPVFISRAFDPMTAHLFNSLPNPSPSDGEVSDVFAAYDAAIAAYEAATPPDYRYSATALRKAVDAALQSSKRGQP